MDNTFDKIIEQLQSIHNNFPDLRFGEVLQIALDNKKKKPNQNLCHSSSKEILSSLDEFKTLLKLKKRKKVKKNGN